MRDTVKKFVKINNPKGWGFFLYSKMLSDSDFRFGFGFGLPSIVECSYNIQGKFFMYKSEATIQRRKRKKGQYEIRLYMTTRFKYTLDYYF